MNFKPLKIKFVFFIIFFFLNIIYAQEWQLIGLENEEIDCIEIDHSNPDIIYVGSRSSFSDGTAGKLFKSVDGGTSWDTLLFGTTVRDIDIHPIDPNILYATLGLNYLTKAGILKSTDGGKAWAKADSGIWIDYGTGPGQLIIDPSNPEKLYVGTSGLFGGAFYISINSGIFWKFINIDSLNGVRAFAVDPVNPLNIYIGDSATGQLFKSIDGGYHWNIAPEQPELAADVLTVSPDTPNIIYAGTLGFGFSTSEDFGETWSIKTTGLPPQCNTTDIALVLHKIFISATPDGGSTYHVYESQKDTIEWKDFGDKTFSNMIRAVTFSTENNALYLGTLGLYKTKLTTNIYHDQNTFGPAKELNIYPNPFNLNTTIEYSLKTQSNVKLELYDISGRKIRTMVNQKQNPGNYRIFFEAKGLSTGLYICYLKTEQYIISRKILLSK